MREPLQRWIVVVGGFTQSRYSGGLRKVWIGLMARHPEPEVRVTSHPWNDDWRGLAGVMEQELRDCEQLYPVDIVCYSWGVGFGAMQLARELKALGVWVRVIVSCDGVSRPWLARWRAFWSPLFDRLIGEPTIRVPGNVAKVVYLRQQTNRPRGHLFWAENGTEFEDRGFLPKGFTHQDADDSREFFELAMEICG